MPRTGRNDPCPCGSGRKAKRCCGTPRGPSEEQLARALVARQARRAAPALAELELGELRTVFDQLVDLPARDLSLLMRLPELVSPELARLYRAIRADDPDAAEDALPAVLQAVDTPQTRARLARAIADLESAGRLGRRLAAVALIDLDSDSDLLVRASLIQAAFVAAGATLTPGGLLVGA
jgi:SEC-C motif